MARGTSSAVTRVPRSGPCSSSTTASGSASAAAVARVSRPSPRSVAPMRSRMRKKPIRVQLPAIPVTRRAEPGTSAAAAAWKAADAEPLAVVELEHGPLRGTRVTADEVPLAIDELPLVALLGCFAEGETVVRGAAELRFKETDRIALVVEGLRGLGAQIEAAEDGFTVTGSGGLRGGAMEAHGDHRLAMLGAVAGLASREGVEVVGMEAAAVSYPGFTADLERLLSPAA